MGIYHSQAYEIEKFTQKLSYKHKGRISADEIDVYPIVAIQFCLIQILSYSHINYSLKLKRIAKVSDEVYLVIGNKRLCDSFNIEIINDDSIIKGKNNKEYLNNLIKFLYNESRNISKIS